MLNRLLWVLSFCQCLLAAVSTGQTRYYEVKTADGLAIRYALVLPAGFDKSKEYATLLALPPGAEDEAMVEEGLKRYWEKEAGVRGWVVASPVSPSGARFFAAHPEAALAVADDVAARVVVKGGRHHLVGVSNGGSDAFSVMLAAPDRFESLLVLPGMLDNEATDEQLAGMAGKHVTMHVGENDAQWLAGARRTVARLRKVGAKVDLHILPAAGHVLDVPAAQLFDAMGGANPPANPHDNPHDNPHPQPPFAPQEETTVKTIAVGDKPQPTNPITPLRPAAKGQPQDTTDAVEDARTRAISAVLDDFHDAAAKADEPRYFAHFTPDAVFLGTDATERWTYAQFRAWAKPHFAIGKGWEYHARDRYVFFSPSGDCAWFDEMLDNAKLGECRGTGVLVKADGVWRIAQYHLVLPVPNELADDLVVKVKKLKAKENSK